MLLLGENSPSPCCSAGTRFSLQERAWGHCTPRCPVSQQHGTAVPQHAARRRAGTAWGPLPAGALLGTSLPNGSQPPLQDTGMEQRSAALLGVGHPSPVPAVPSPGLTCLHSWGTFGCHRGEKDLCPSVQSPGSCVPITARCLQLCWPPAWWDLRTLPGGLSPPCHGLSHPQRAACSAELTLSTSCWGRGGDGEGRVCPRAAPPHTAPSQIQTPSSLCTRAVPGAGGVLPPLGAGSHWQPPEQGEQLGSSTTSV